MYFEKKKRYVKQLTGNKWGKAGLGPRKWVRDIK